MPTPKMRMPATAPRKAVTKKKRVTNNVGAKRAAIAKEQQMSIQQRDIKKAQADATAKAAKDRRAAARKRRQDMRNQRKK